MELLADLLLLAGLTLRLTRLVTTDDLGDWLVRTPAERWAERDWREKLVSGLDCPFCVGFWIGVVALLTLIAAGGPGDAASWWRYGAGALALNYVVGHIAARLD